MPTYAPPSRPFMLSAKELAVLFEFSHRTGFHIDDLLPGYASPFSTFRSVSFVQTIRYAQAMVRFLSPPPLPGSAEISDF